MKRNALFLALGICLFASNRWALAQVASPKLSALANMPVREVTVFKDDYAFVRHEGDMPTDTNGDVLMDYLPTPVLGTFWPYSAAPDVKLVSVTSARRQVEVDRTALTLREMFRANVGADVFVTEGDNRYSATIVGFPTRSSEEISQTSAPGSGEQLPIESDIVLLRTNEGTSAVPFDRITEVTFKNSQNSLSPDKEFRNLLTLRLGWPTGHAGATAKVGLLYMQYGLKWTPSYRITINGAGNAHVELRATIVNDLTDLDDVTANLVIGVPTFKFKDMTDSMALQEALAGPESAAQRSSTNGWAFSNAIESQVVAGADYGGGTVHAGGPSASSPGGDGAEPGVSDAEKTEDMFVFTVSHLTLHRGERVQVPVAEYNVKYTDVFKLDVPIAPPAEIPTNYNYNQRQEMEQETLRPHVIHAIRLVNDTKYPITTAPALIVKDQLVLGQGMTTYTAIGGQCDLDITDAVDVPVTLKQHEVKRTPNSITANNVSYMRVDMSGSVCLTNYKSTAVVLEVNRYVLGVLDSADHDGIVEQSTTWDDASFYGGSFPLWWSSYSWPYWWGEYNGAGKATWKLTLPAGNSTELGYNWHYYLQ